jgi:DNA-directed RNA polymerase II subunit RPB2
MDHETYDWTVLADFFKKYGFVHHQIESFDDFVYHGIERAMTEEPGIVVPLKDREGEHRITFNDVYIPKPTVLEEDRNLRTIFPSEARTRDLTYDSPIYVTVTETIAEEGKKPIHSTHRRVVIGRIPIMLKSGKCSLSGLSPDEIVRAGECHKDPGGYFIVKGKERVIISQIRGTYNVPMVFSQKPKNGEKFEYVCEVRSMSEETGHSVLVQCMIGLDKRTLVFSLPYIKNPIPIGVVFKALGYITDEQISDLVGLKTESMQPYMDLILRDSFFVDSQERALDHIGAHAKNPLNKAERAKYAWQVLEGELFPHMGVCSTIKEKAYFVGHMVHKLMSTHLKMREPDDRDNYVNKRIEPTGVLCFDLFRTLYKNYIDSIAQVLADRKQRPDILSVMARHNIITSGFRHCYATGKWGAQKNSYTRAGVSQVLCRLTYGATLSHLRRATIPIGKEGKNAKMRQIHPSQAMFLCPTETPEGAAVGIVLNFSLLTKMSRRVPTVQIKHVVETMESITLLNDFIGDNDQTKIFVNGTFMGMTDDSYTFVDEFKDLRDSKLIHRDVSVGYDDIDDEIHIFSDEGRMTRPVYKVQDEKIVACPSEGTNWDDLVEKGHIVYVDNMEVNTAVVAFYRKELVKYRNDYCEISPAMMFGVMASTIPFPDHSQSPRNVYQSAMGKQAMGMFCTAYNIRTDTVVHVLDYPQKPLVTTKAATMMGFDDMPSGINAIVAVLAYTGFNQEDSVLVKKSAIERGMFTATTYRNFTDCEKKQGTHSYEKIVLTGLDIRRKNLNYGLLDSQGIVKRGAYVDKNDVIISKCLIESNKSGDEEVTDCSMHIKKGEEGTVDRRVISITPDGYKLVKVIIRTSRIPEVGDKFATRSAQKGTCGAIIQEEDMPFNCDGITPDIIINAHAFPSRMTVNQLLECVLSKTGATTGKFGDATPFTSSSIAEEIDGVEVPAVDKICEALRACGHQPEGLEVLCNGMTGDPLNAMVFMGPTYYQRLKHLVSDKMHARAYGPVTTLTKQPLEGRSRDGGLRFGEMERDAMISQGNSEMLKERLFTQSDYYKLAICNECGNIATTRTECKPCQTDDVSIVNFPYVAKLLCQELNAMVIRTRIEAKK